MLVTIIADASHCPNTKAAGYACWISSNRGTVFRSGCMRQPCVSSLVAEMMALVNGICVGLKEGLIHNGDTLCLQTDCIPAIDKLKGAAEPSCRNDIMVIDFFNKTLTNFFLTPYFKHVRGHTSVKDGRSAVNRRCDTKARKHMQKMRSSLKIKELRSMI